MCLRHIPFLYLYKQSSRKDNDRLLQTSSKTRDVINKRPGSTLFQREFGIRKRLKKLWE